ncbi:MAG: hypothetical protein US86_C0009G0039 [Candidatus Daviesbacteria bacterium GW2011_GWA2_38_24]|uniref:Yip1 domain-containing protein n=1 Tax=Candidatus Daviesbacteria bacterium GW2011_GWA2_38_24 TaxID=1618422 RepID=A0A0G0ML78_9BACT|nr:MAG: hypothetical protein US86_C0009G0039 [Candidatus Daviesbacteria bacterium GW2011_GWA2_38_24]KKQ79281.1 MAG: hypothetical protein UT01_C0044G0012 [Candidatus Daviesbacteria bacterium GW2011_GWA1_38_7]OGE23863.1 MAG: hypothetical protein A2688_02630 [Candidatus Daviesbacteria bacterium RIFCSPHIGHO2_01_FULL_38_8]
MTSSFFSLIRGYFLNPYKYFKQPVSKSSFSSALLFLCLNGVLGMFIVTVKNAYFSQRITTFFLGINQLFFYVPFYLITGLALGLSLFVIAKVIGGKGSFTATLWNLALVSPSLIFVGFYKFFVILVLWSSVILIRRMYQTHQYSMIKAASNVLFPLLLLLLIKTALSF